MSLRSFETGNLSADNFKKVLDLDGSTLEPAVRSGDTGQRIPCFDSCQLIKTLMCNHVQLVFSWASKLARKYHSKHWFPCGADGRSGVRSLTLGWVDYHISSPMGLRPRARFARGWSSANMILRLCSTILK